MKANPEAFMDLDLLYYSQMTKHAISFKVALEGISYALRTQPNFRVHTIASIFSVILGLLLNITQVEWVVLSLTIMMVFTAEMINTSIESMTDLITTEHRKSAKIAKDVAAGVVLTAAIGSVIVGALIFLPKIMVF